MTLPRVPVRYIKQNEELLKSQSGPGMPTTDYREAQNVPESRPQPTYRRAADRPTGNVLFRRYPNGQLDVEYAKHKVIDAVHQYKNEAPLTPMQQAALQCCFPNMFNYVPSTMLASMMRVNMRISPEEAAMVAMAVAMHLQEEMKYRYSSHAR